MATGVAAMPSDLQRLQDEFSAALAGLSATQTQATPAAHPEKWSIQQIVEHLLQTYRATITAIQVRLDKRTPTRAAPTLQQRVGQFLVIDLGRFPRGRPAPAAVSPSLPSSLRSGEELVSHLSRELAELETVAAAGERLFANRRAVSHMILGPLSLPQWRRFHLIHGRHHMRQIKAIRRDHRI